MRGLIHRLIWLFLWLPLASMAAPYSQIINFGDSLSDTGRIYAMTKYPPAPYYQGRAANGKLWIEYLSDSLGIPYNADNNFAWIGAMTGSNNESNLLPNLGFKTEIENYLTANPKADSTALYTIWIGANDFSNGVTDPTSAVASAIDNIMGGVERLIKAGATNILVLGLPDLGITPKAKMLGIASVSTQLSSVFNQTLVVRLKQLSTHVNFLDIAALLQDVVQHPQNYGFNNVISACLTSENLCDNPDQYLFWDWLHPTTRAHKFVAQMAYRLLIGAEYDVATQILQLPVVEVVLANGTTTTFSAQLQALSNTLPLTFTVLESHPVMNRGSVSQPVFDVQTGKISLSVVNVNQTRYQATLQRTGETTFVLNQVAKQ